MPTSKERNTMQHDLKAATKGLYFNYTNAKEVLFQNHIDWEVMLYIVGDPGNASYEYVIRSEDGKVMHSSDCGYGIFSICLRDALCLYHGAPEVSEEE
jgi:hypothetical protein